MFTCNTSHSHDHEEQSKQVSNLHTHMCIVWIGYWIYHYIVTAVTRFVRPVACTLLQADYVSYAQCFADLDNQATGSDSGTLALVSTNSTDAGDYRPGTWFRCPQ